MYAAKFLFTEDCGQVGFFINSPAHKKSKQNSYLTKRNQGANVSTTAKGEKIQKIPAVAWFSPQQPANTYRQRCQVLWINQKIWSTEGISEKFMLTQEVFSSPLNAFPNPIIQFHPGFLQWIICKQKLEVSRKSEVLVRKGQRSNYYNRELISFSESSDSQALKLNFLVSIQLQTSVLKRSQKIKSRWQIIRSFSWLLQRRVCSELPRTTLAYMLL